MKEFIYTVTDPQGIHARPAGELVKLAKEFTSSVTISKDGKSGDCKKNNKQKTPGISKYGCHGVFQG